MPSPSYQPDSPTSSIPSRDSDQRTLTYQRHSDIPEHHISVWDAEDVGRYVASIGLEQYRESFIDEGIVGETLIHLDHDILRDMGIRSVGHRLTILKNTYNVKIAHGVTIESDHYIPVSADADEGEKAATQHDIQRLVAIIRRRDEKILHAERELQKLQESFLKLREELLPVWRLVKNKDKALPTPSSQGGSYNSQPPLATPPAYSPEPVPARDQEREREIERREIERRETIKRREREEREARDARDARDAREREQVQDPPFTGNNPNLLPAPSGAKSLSRKFSMKKLILGTPKNASPTHPTHPDTVRNEHESPPTTTNGTAKDIRDSPAMPSPTSPSTVHHLSGGTIVSSHTPGSSYKSPEVSRRPVRANDYDEPSTGGGSQPTVEIFKSFRVSMEDPCHKVLPAALKRYNIQADWRQYALYIVHGDQERCLGLDEKPLILFKQLDREGRKPMFMLRRNGNFEGGGGGSGMPASSGASVYGREQGITLPGVLPGGVL